MRFLILFAKQGAIPWSFFLWCWFRPEAHFYKTLLSHYRNGHSRWAALGDSRSRSCASQVLARLSAVPINDPRLEVDILGSSATHGSLILCRSAALLLMQLLRYLQTVLTLQIGAGCIREEHHINSLGGNAYAGTTLPTQDFAAEVRADKSEGWRMTEFHDVATR